MVFKKGNVPWNKGKTGLFHHTEEFKQQQRERMIGRTYGGFKKGHIPWHKGKTGVYSREVLDKKRERMLGNKRWLGRKHTEETKRKISEEGKKRITSEETKQKLRQYKGERASFYGRKHTEETKQKMRVARVNRPPFPKRDTSIEKVLHTLLGELELSYEKHINVCDVAQPDIVFPKERLAVFADGDYWHSKEFKNGMAWEKDRRQDKTLRENGWTVLRFWGSEINANPEQCIAKIVFEVNKCQ